MQVTIKIILDSGKEIEFTEQEFEELKEKLFDAVNMQKLSHYPTNYFYTVSASSDTNIG